MPDTNHDGPVPTTRLASLQGLWAFEISCGRCRRLVKLPIDVVITSAGDEVRLYEVVDRFRCTSFVGSATTERCRGRPSKVLLRKFQHHGKSLRTLQTIVIFDSSRT